MFNDPRRLLALVASTCLLVAAAPAPEAPRAPKTAIDARSVEDLVLYGLPEGKDPKTFVKRSELGRRADQNSFHDGIPGCGDDPSYAQGKSRYNDGDGTLIDSGACDNKIYTGGWHCWNDMYFVNVQTEYSDWINTGQTIDCATTSSCALQGINLNQSCTATAEIWDNAYNPSIEAKIDVESKVKWGIGGGFSYTHNSGGSETKLTCKTVSDSGTCTWEDKKCHAIWKGKRNKRIYGYVRRSCDKNRSGTNMPDTAKRPDGYYTVGMLDFDFSVPDNQVIGCGATCENKFYPNPKPSPEEVQAWPGS